MEETEDKLTEMQEEQNLDERLGNIREICGAIQARIETQDPDMESETLEELWWWCQEVSGQTYKWSDEY